MEKKETALKIVEKNYMQSQPIKIAAYISIEILKAKRAKNDVFHVIKDNNCKYRFLCLVKLLITMMERENFPLYKVYKFATIK